METCTSPCAPPVCLSFDARVATTTPITESFNFVWYNLANTPRDIPPFAERASRIAELLSGDTLQADIIGLTELRETPTISVAAFLATVCRLSGDRYGTEIGRVSAVPGYAFSLALLYNMSKFWVSEKRVLHMEHGEFPGGRMPLTRHATAFDRSPMARHVLAVRLAPVTHGRVHTHAPFWVILSHLNIDPTDNMLQCEWLNSHLPVVTRGEPYLAMMDSNWFRDAGGARNRDAVRKLHTVHVFENAKEAGTGVPMWNTFSGFVSDPFQVPDLYATAEPGAVISDLDTVFTDTAHDWIVDTPEIITATMLPDEASIDKRTFHNFPSDHFPVRVRVQLPPTPSVHTPCSCD